MQTKTIPVPRIPAAARKAGATKIQRTTGNVFAVGFKPRDAGGNPNAVRDVFAQNWQVKWSGHDHDAMILRPINRDAVVTTQDGVTYRADACLALRSRMVLTRWNSMQQVIVNVGEYVIFTGVTRDSDSATWCWLQCETDAGELIDVCSDQVWAEDRGTAWQLVCAGGGE